MDKVTIDQFRSQVKPTRGSKLDPFRDEILALYDEGYSLDQVMEFLALNEVQVAKSTLHGFIKKINSVAKKSMTIEKKYKREKNKRASGEPDFKGFKFPNWAISETNLEDLI